jgi:hypothetical protein
MASWTGDRRQCRCGDPSEEREGSGDGASGRTFCPTSALSKEAGRWIASSGWSGGGVYERSHAGLETGEEMLELRARARARARTRSKAVGNGDTGREAPFREEVVCC